jgi:hypothetical protein
MAKTLFLLLALAACGGANKGDTTTPKAAPTDGSATPGAGAPASAPAAPMGANPCGK